jgi:hypothetical protein
MMQYEGSRDGKITWDELRESIERLFRVFDVPDKGGKLITRGYVTNNITLADYIFDDVKNHREPKWNVGDVVADSRNVVFTRTIGGWYKAGDRTFYDNSVPHRPLQLIWKGPV